MIRLALVLLTLGVNAFAGEVEWARFKGTVKEVNLKERTVKLQNKDGDLFTVPVDFQVKIVDKKNVLRELKDLELDDPVTLIKVISEKPKEDSEGLVPYSGGMNPEPEKQRRNK
jgi:hypothetical protein